MISRYSLFHFSSREHRWLYRLCILLLSFDRLTKSLAHTAAQHGMYYKDFTSWLSFGYTINRGISWGMFNGSHDMVAYGITAFLCFANAAFIYYTWLRARQGNTVIGELLVSVGGVSNLIDRFMYGGVVDFIVLHWHDYYFPSFNGADTFICLGIGIMIYHELRNYA